MPRSKKSQSAHDAEVRRTAQALQRQGFDVKADVSGFATPATISGYRPDVIATKGTTRKIVEVETTDSVNTARDRAQQSAFRASANRSKNTTFSRKVVDK